MSTLSFRLATVDDIPALHSLVTSAYRGESSRAGWTTEADILDGQRVDPSGIASDIARDRSAIVVGECDDRIVACCHIAANESDCYFGMFAVNPTQQGAGIGKQVMAFAENYAAREWNLKQMRMTVIDCRSELMEFYERRGYRRTGVKTPFPYGNERCGIPKVSTLQFEDMVKCIA